MQPVDCIGCPKGPWGQPFPVDIEVWPHVSGLGSRQVCSVGGRGTFGKPPVTVAKVRIGQVIMSICTKLQNKESVIEALHRAKFKFPGRQKIHIPKKWGFTQFIVDEFVDVVAEKRLIPDG
ncbi:60S ribosomal protein L10-like [Herpailurus yagouaroundi]|uniref:60S ribosomal protein L10-like n=1 Tax=Herpailurus yagouaroundi TaxID=1608482 RepID=UPI001AD651BA|nr:60S ribosomal protein L10-like [Puma yagouaroundi]